MNCRTADTGRANATLEPMENKSEAPRGELVIGSFPLARRFAPPRRKPRRERAVQLALDLEQT